MFRNHDLRIDQSTNPLEVCRLVLEQHLNVPLMSRNEQDGRTAVDVVGCDLIRRDNSGRFVVYGASNVWWTASIQFMSGYRGSVVTNDRCRLENTVIISKCPNKLFKKLYHSTVSFSVSNTSHFFMRCYSVCHLFPNTPVTALFGWVGLRVDSSLFYCTYI